MTGDLDRIRAICMTHPRAAEKISHGIPVFFIEKGRTFAWYSENHHGSGITAVLVKTSGADEQAFLVEMDPDIFYRPPYLAPSGWIGMRLDTDATDWDQVEARIAQSWDHAATPRLREQFGR
ncbi:MmcQ/YjbR family DNA-binding protein [Sphingomonas abietis]|uniref:MmcQ/YjbR family DNA-binding protein n=1 Tax=Sphingomonas abietis TaxID=3012344 RepID=UPI002DD61E6D|nr:MmcQ/YjbR family DNA-binding protein [Sphingomonas abietis]